LDTRAGGGDEAHSDRQRAANSEPPVGNNEPAPDILALLPAHIKAYDLKDHHWRTLLASNIMILEWNKEAFKELALPDETKSMLLALISTDSQSEVNKDIVAGKRRGQVFLFHGPPGVGKTFAAESISEVTERPLYRINMADVGTTAKDVDRVFRNAITLAKRWGCVLLLDEADLLVEARSAHDFNRNAVVAAFIRLIDELEGILIITTNRVGSFDTAFKSRISLAVHFHKLNNSQRKIIWRNFLQRTDISLIQSYERSTEFEELVESPLNGREIRNAILSAQQIAKYRGQNLDLKTIIKVVESSSAFDKQLNTVANLDGSRSERDS
jgi:SpoVK/Ycf46/Vps4 family AAA+-type ATPase